MNDSLPEQLTELITDLEPITPKLCKELLAKGFKQDDLNTVRLHGFLYNRSRNSFVCESF